MMDKAGCVALVILVALCSCRAPIPGDVERKGPAGRAREHDTRLVGSTSAGLPAYSRTRRKGGLGMDRAPQEDAEHRPQAPELSR